MINKFNMVNKLNFKISLVENFNTGLFWSLLLIVASYVLLVSLRSTLNIRLLLVLSSHVNVSQEIFE